MTDSDYDVIKRAAYDEAAAFLRDAESATDADADDEIFPELFSEMLDAYPQYEADEISQVVHWGISDAWYDIMRDGYGARYFD